MPRGKILGRKGEEVQGKITATLRKKGKGKPLKAMQGKRKDYCSPLEGIMFSMCHLAANQQEEVQRGRMGKKAEAFTSRKRM